MPGPAVVVSPTEQPSPSIHDVELRPRWTLAQSEPRLRSGRCHGPGVWWGFPTEVGIAAVGVV